MATDTFAITVADAGDDLLITCEGDLDTSTADRFRDSVDWVVALNPERMHLDCSGVTFIDSIGIRAMAHLASACRGRGIVLTLTINESMQRLFDTSGVSGLFSLAR